MRDIKFRAWNGERMIKNAIPTTNGFYGYFEKEGYESVFKNSFKGELMQYTGLKDKNGVGNEVYEGDIFECIFSNIPNGFKSLNTNEVQIKQIATVIYKMGMFQIRVFHPDYDQYVSYPLSDFLENKQKVVIGNIHENPELIQN